MSYILEALKKAQAERQLGSAPTIHAPVVHLQAASSANRKPLVIGFAAGALLVAGALVAWRVQGPSAPAQTVATAQQARSDSQAAPGQGMVQASPAVTQGGAEDGAAATGQRNANANAPAAATQVPAPREGVALVSDESTHAPAVVSKPAPAGPGNAQVPGASGVTAQAAPAARAGAPLQGGPQPQAMAPRRAAAGAAPAVAPAAAQPAAVVAASAQPPIVAPAASAAGSDAALPTLGALPDAVRGSVPKIAFGGYMYSANPADRLILVDNILRHEGEEVAPGLVLEKLLPKGAVMIFRGYRYRVAF
jgi:general secretion pathway protein B